MLRRNNVLSLNGLAARLETVESNCKFTSSNIVLDVAASKQDCRLAVVQSSKCRRSTMMVGASQRQRVPPKTRRRRKIPANEGQKRGQENLEVILIMCSKDCAG